MEKQYWYIALLIILIFWYLNQSTNESFVSGTEKMLVSYEENFPLDHPKYTTPQQKYFQQVLSEHSALDPNLQNIRPDIATQQCQSGTPCFETKEWHALNHKTSSSPNIINSRVDHPESDAPVVKYQRHQGNKIVPANSRCKEMRADLYDEIILPELYFKRKVMYNPKTEAHPEERQYLTNIY